MNTPNIYTDRLITLSDGTPGLRGTIHMEVREPSLSSTGGEGQGEEAPSNTLDFISSDETLDRYDEVISASGWNLDTYRKNPVFQNAHQCGDIIYTLGRALITEVRTAEGVRAHSLSASGGEGQGEVASRSLDTRHSTLSGSYLFQRIQFAVDANPMAKIAHALYKGKFLNAVSVGFVPVRWEDAPPSSSSSFSSSSSIPRRRYLEQELLEVSAVAIPANPNALALALKSGVVEKSDLRDLSDLLRHVLPIRPISGRTLQFARQLRELLKHT